MTSAMVAARHGQRPGHRQQRRVPEPVLHRAPAVHHHPRAQRDRRRVRPPRAAALLGHAMTTIASAGTGDQREPSGKASSATSGTSPGTVFLVLLLGSLLFSLAILFILLADVMSKGLPVFAERGTDFLTSPLSSNPAKAGVAQGIIGTAILGVIVAVTAFPFGLATAIYLEEYARRGPADAVHPDQHPQPRRRAVGRLRPARAVGVRRPVPVAGDRQRPQHPRGRRHARRARPPDRDHHLDRGPAGRARWRSARPATASGASRWEVTRQLVLPAAAPGRPHRHGPRPVAGARRDGAADPRGRGARLVLGRRWTSS